MIYFSIETGNFTDFFRDCPRKRSDEIEARMYVSCVLMLIAKSFEPIKNKFFMCGQENLELCGGRCFVRGCSSSKTKNKTSRASLLVYFEIASRLRWKIPATTRRVVISGQIKVFVSRFCKVRRLATGTVYVIGVCTLRDVSEKLSPPIYIHFYVHEI